MSSKKNLLVVPAFNTNSFAVVRFSVVASLMWNNFPQHIRDAGSLDVFKRRLKTAFLYVLFKFMK